MAEKQLIVAIEGTAALGPYWQTILLDYLDRIIRCFYGNELTGQKLSGATPELSLVVFNTHGPYSAFIVQRSAWTKDLDVFFQWLSGISFVGGGFSEAAIAEGLAEALTMFPVPSSATQTHQNLETHKHCILVAASNPHLLPTPVYCPSIPSLEHIERSEAQPETCLADAETVAKSFGLCSVSLSVISPKPLLKLRAIYNAGKRSPRTADLAIDHVKNPQYLVLISENFMEARAVLSHPSIGNSAANQGIVKLDGASTAVSGPPSSSTTSVIGSTINRQAVPVGNIPIAAVKVESTTVPSMIPGPAFSHIPSISNVNSQGVASLQTSSPSPTSQEMNATSDGMQEHKPLVNTMPQSMIRPVGPAPANVNILNNLSQHRQMMNSASLAGASSIGLQTMGGTHMAMHMSNMISSGMVSSAMSGMTSMAGSAALLANAQVPQNTSLGSFTPATSSLSGNSNIGISPALANLQGNIGIGQTLPGSMGQGSLASGGQVGQGGIAMNQNLMNSNGTAGISSGPGTMIPTPGMSQQAGVHSLGVANNSNISMSSTQHTSVQQSQSKYVRIWEGALSGQRQGQPVFICKLEGYRSASASETLATDWPATMQIVRLIAQDHMNNKQYVGKADFLVFRTLNQHGFLAQLQEKKLCAVIQLPTQTLLLSVSDKAGRLIGMLFPGVFYRNHSNYKFGFPLKNVLYSAEFGFLMIQDMVVFKPQVSSQQLQQSNQHLQQQQQMLGSGMTQQQQLQQQHSPQQMLGSGMTQHQQHSPQQMLGSGMMQHQQQPPQQQMLGSGMTQHQQQMLGSGMTQQQQMLSSGMTQQQQQQQQMLGSGMTQQQMVGSGMTQGFGQGAGRSQIMSQGKVGSQGPSNIPGGGFLP